MSSKKYQAIPPSPPPLPPSQGGISYLTSSLMVAFTVGLSVFVFKSSVKKFKAKLAAEDRLTRVEEKNIQLSKEVQELKREIENFKK